MSYTCFDLSIADKVATITMKRPEKRNSMIPEFWDELPEIVRMIDDQVKARVIVIASTGPHFSAGLDIGAFLENGDTDSGGLPGGPAFLQKVDAMQRSFSAIAECRIPVLAAVQGGCIGGGVDLATACDMRYASSDAFFSVEEVNIGMTADVGTFPRLTHLIPEGIVRELCYTGDRLSAEDAKALGLVNAVFADHESLLEGVQLVARKIASKAPLAVYGCKRMIDYSRDHSTQDTLDYVGVWNASFLLPEQMMEALQARMQKRDGDFAELPVVSRSVAKSG